MKVFIVWSLIDGTMHEDDRKFIDKIFSTKDSAEKYVDSKSKFLKFYISEVEVEE